MERWTRSSTLLLALGAALLAFPALADDTEMPAAEGPEMEAMMAAMEPGEQHQFLARLEGDWTFTSMMWMDPSEPPTESVGTSKKAMIMGGRYLQEEVSGEAMGSHFDGRAVTGYDNTAGEFVGTWLDSIGTGIAVVKGQRDGDTLTMHGETLDPMTKQMTKVRWVIRILDADRHVFAYYMSMQGMPEFKSMQIEYRRQASE